jgi:hypothetical protein
MGGGIASDYARAVATITVAAIFFRAMSPRRNVANTTPEPEGSQPPQRQSPVKQSQAPQLSTERALTDIQLRNLVANGAIECPIELDGYVQPARCVWRSVPRGCTRANVADQLALLSYVPHSVDLPISGNVYLVKEKVLPFRKSVRSLLEELVLEEKNLDGEDGAVLLRGQT